MTEDTPTRRPRPQGLIDLVASVKKDEASTKQEITQPIANGKVMDLETRRAGTRPAKKYSARLDNLISEYQAMEAEDAIHAGTLGFMPHALVQVTMPHSRPAREQTTFVRRNGAFSLALMAHPQIGLPYGSLPRLLMSYLTTEAVRMKSREIVLGKSMSEFMANLHEVPTGGRWGSISRVKDQTMRLLSASIACTYSEPEGMSGLNLAVADSYKLWWNPLNPDQLSSVGNSVTLGERFFDEVISRPVPIDLRALIALKKSPLALDLYVWLTYRMSYLRRATVIPWPALAAQFGADYTRLRSFRAAFLNQLKAVLVIYPRARVHTDNSIGLTISPSPTHIPVIRRRARA